MTETKAFRVVVRDSSDTYATNALTFDTIEDARAYACDLASRWLAIRSWAILATDIHPDTSSYWSRAIVEERAAERRDY